MSDPQNPHLYYRKSNLSLYTGETFYGKQTIYVETASVCGAMSAAVSHWLK